MPILTRASQQLCNRQRQHRLMVSQKKRLPVVPLRPMPVQPHKQISRKRLQIVPLRPLHQAISRATAANLLIRSSLGWCQSKMDGCVASARSSTPQASCVSWCVLVEHGYWCHSLRRTAGSWPRRLGNTIDRTATSYGLPKRQSSCEWHWSWIGTSTD